MELRQVYGSVEMKAHLDRLHTPSLTRSHVLPGVPTMILVTLPTMLTVLRALIYGALSTPAETMTVAMLREAPSMDIASWVCSVSSRIGANTWEMVLADCDSTRTLSTFWMSLAEDAEISRGKVVGMLNANVLPLRLRNRSMCGSSRFITYLPVS